MSSISLSMATSRVSGAVSTKNILPVLTHFGIREGRLHAYNGRVYITAPATGLEDLPSMTVPALPFMAAVNAAEASGKAPTFVVQEKRLAMKAGKFRATIPIGQTEEFPFMGPRPKMTKVKTEDGVLARLRLLRPFIGEDASRPWSAAVRMVDGAMYATNNVSLVRVPNPDKWPAMDAAIPVFAVDELLRIGEEPIAVAQDSTTMTFLLPGDVVLRSQLLEGEWPDVAGMLKTLHQKAKYTPIPDDLLERVRRVVPISEDTSLPAVCFGDGKVYTQKGANGQGAEEEGLPGVEGAVFHADQLTKTLQVATVADWQKFPRVPWKGAHGLLGVVLGLKT